MNYLHLYLYYTFSSNINPYIPDCVAVINALLQEDRLPSILLSHQLHHFCMNVGSRSEQCVFKRFSFTDYKTSLFSTDKRIN